MGMFGQHLVSEGVISLDELQQAVDYKKQANKTFGQVAVEQGYLSASDLEEVLKEQLSYKRMSTGEVAVFLGKLDDDEVAEIARAQQESNIRLGDALIACGILDADQVKEQLVAFEIVRTKW